ncbi:MAG: hypothetical protein NVSMB10_11130 [Steroidobacteraceae bacterium]
MPTRTAILIFAAALIACHPAKTPTPTAQDIEAAARDASREVEQARTEAAKDVRNAAKIEGPGSYAVTHAKATAAYDVAMVRADGDHTVATEKCLTLPAPAIEACKQRADADYEASKTAAKNLRLARER